MGRRLVADSSPAGANFYDYDGAGRLTNHAVHGRTRAFTYDFTGRMTTLTDTNGSVLAYEFDAEGNRLSQALNDCLSTRFVHDGPDVLLELNPANAVAYAWVIGCACRSSPCLWLQAHDGQGSTLGLLAPDWVPEALSSPPTRGQCVPVRSLCTTHGGARGERNWLAVRGNRR